MSQRNVPPASTPPGGRSTPGPGTPSEAPKDDDRPLFRPATPTRAFGSADLAQEAVRASQAPPRADDASGFSHTLPKPTPPPSRASGPPPRSVGRPVGGERTIATATVGEVSVRAELSRSTRTAGAHVMRSRGYAFVLDSRGAPVEIGSGRFAKAYLGEERWLESKTDYRQSVVIKILQKGVTDEDRMRFQIEKELLERVQGHPNIVVLYASGESDDPDFIPPAIREKVENDFQILERLDMSLEERLKGVRSRGKREDLLSYSMRDRLFRVLDYMIPVASAIEYSHLVKNVCHRDIKPANILLRLPDPSLRGSTLEVRLADFNVAKLHDDEVSYQMTRLKSVPGTLFFQSPEQETNLLELLVNVEHGSPEVEFFEDFYIQIAKNDMFSLYNRGEEYTVLYCDRAKKRIVLERPYREVSESNVRAKIRKSVGRPADIYSLGATLYYLISGAYANPKTLYDAFHKFIEYENADETNTIAGYLSHEYGIIQSLRAPKQEKGAAVVAPADRFFTYKQYLDGNGELIEQHVMEIIARCMIRNKPDSYCQAHDIETKGIGDLVQDLIDLYAHYGFHPAAGSTQLTRRARTPKSAVGVGHRVRRFWWAVLRVLGLRRRR